MPLELDAQMLQIKHFGLGGRYENEQLIVGNGTGSNDIRSTGVTTRNRKP